MSKLQDTLAYPPRGMDAERAAAYVGLSRSKFLELVDAGDAPAPMDLGGCPRWDRYKIDHWLDVKADYVKKSNRTTLDDILGAGRGGDQAPVRKQLQRQIRRPTAPV